MGAFNIFFPISCLSLHKSSCAISPISAENTEDQVKMNGTELVVIKAGNIYQELNVCHTLF